MSNVVDLDSARNAVRITITNGDTYRYTFAHIENVIFGRAELPPPEVMRIIIAEWFLHMTEDAQ